MLYCLMAVTLCVMGSKQMLPCPSVSDSTDFCVFPAQRVIYTLLAGLKRTHFPPCLSAHLHVLEFSLQHIWELAQLYVDLRADTLLFFYF